jgi:hypothetical protein
MGRRKATEAFYAVFLMGVKKLFDEFHLIICLSFCKDQIGSCEQFCVSYFG